MRKQLTDDDDLALLSSPGLITCSDNSLYSTDINCLPTVAQLPPLAPPQQNPPRSLLPPQFSSQPPAPVVSHTAAQFLPHPAVHDYQQCHLSITNRQQCQSSTKIPLPFSTPPKLRPVEEIMREHTGKEISAL